MNTEMHVLIAYFLEYVLLFLDDNVGEEYEQIQIAKVQPQGIALLLLIFLPISAWRCL